MALRKALERRGLRLGEAGPGEVGITRTAPNQPLAMGMATTTDTLHLAHRLQSRQAPPAPEFSIAVKTTPWSGRRAFSLDIHVQVDSIFFFLTEEGSFCVLSNLSDFYAHSNDEGNRVEFTRDSFLEETITSFDSVHSSVLFSAFYF